MSMCVRKPTIWVPTRSDTNRPVQSQKKVRRMKFRIEEEGGWYYPCCENRGADQLLFVFANADCWFSHTVGALSHILIFFEVSTKYISSCVLKKPESTFNTQDQIFFLYLVK